MATKTKAWINLILFSITLGINFLGATGQINNLSQSDVSDRYHTLITPAGFTFSIWSVIYGLMLISILLMIVKHNERYYKKTIEATSFYLWVAFIANSLWIVSFSYLQIGISTIFIFIYLFSLMFIIKQLHSLNDTKRWVFPLTFGIHAGWVFIASVVNIAAFLVQIEWNGFGLSDELWAILIMIIAGLLALFVLLQVKNATFTLPIAWAFFGINQELQNTVQSTSLNILSLVLVAILSMAAIFLFIRNQYSISPINTRYTY